MKKIFYQFLASCLAIVLASGPVSAVRIYADEIPLVRTEETDSFENENTPDPENADRTENDFFGDHKTEEGTAEEFETDDPGSVQDPVMEENDLPEDFFGSDSENGAENSLQEEEVPPGEDEEFIDPDSASEDTIKAAAASEDDNRISLYQATIPKTAMTYNGNYKTQTNSCVVTALVDGVETVLTYGTDYTISYENNRDVGTATMTITGKGNYKGTLVKKFVIRPIKTTLSYLTAGTKRVAIRWNKQDVEISGYQIYYSTKKDFSSNVKKVFISDPSAVSKTVTGLKSGKTYYVKIRTYKTVSGKNYYSTWSSALSVKLALNHIKVTGSGTTRKVILMNPASSLTSVKLRVWSKTGGEDDVKTYTMSKKSDGSFQVSVLAAYLKHAGTCYAQCYSEKTVLGSKTFKFSSSEYKATKNTVLVRGTGSVRTLKVLNPSSAKDVQAAVWTEEGGQDDLTWISMRKLSDGSWSANLHMAYLRHGGTVNLHFYSNDRKTFLNSRTFTYVLSDEEIPWDSSWEFASYSKVHTGTAKLYRAVKNRKSIVVGINSGHGTILPYGQDNYVYSHPDKTPKTTGGSTQAGAVFTICDNSGMTFNDGTPEAQVTLEEGLILKDVLLNAGYDVIMIRENNDSGLDVIARTVICNNFADCHLSLHWDGDGLGYDKGIFFMSVADGIKNMYPTSTVWQKNDRLGNCLITGMKKQKLKIFESGSMQMDLMQTSYSKVPSVDIELGNQSSTHTKKDLQERAKAILKGLNLFFK